MSKVMRSVKNVTKGYSSVQVKVREGMCFPLRPARPPPPRPPDPVLTHFPATSNDPWGPTGTQMSEIAQLTFNSYASSTAGRCSGVSC